MVDIDIAYAEIHDLLYATKRGRKWHTLRFMGATKCGLFLGYGTVVISKAFITDDEICLSCRREHHGRNTR